MKKVIILCNVIIVVLLIVIGVLFAENQQIKKRAFNTNIQNYDYMIGDISRLKGMLIYFGNADKESSRQQSKFVQELRILDNDVHQIRVAINPINKPSKNLKQITDEYYALLLIIEDFGLENLNTSLINDINSQIENMEGQFKKVGTITYGSEQKFGLSTEITNNILLDMEKIKRLLRTQ